MPAQVTLLGHAPPLAGQPSGDGLAIKFPAAAAVSLAYTLKIEMGRRP